MWQMLVVFILIFSAGANAQAVIAPAALVPSGLNPGDTFFVIFTTSARSNLCKQDPLAVGLSPMDDTAAISQANTAATTGSLTNGITGWQALYIHERSDAMGVITDTVAASGSAFNNNITQPIYNILGSLVANDRSDLFDGGIAGGGTDLINTFDVDENGNAFPGGNFAYTGFDALGVRAATRTLGYGGTGCAVGDPDTFDDNWAFAGPSNSERGIYVLSPLLTVAAATSSAAAAVPVAPFGFILMLGFIMAFAVQHKLKK